MQLPVGTVSTTKKDFIMLAKYILCKSVYLKNSN